MQTNVIKVQAPGVHDTNGIPIDLHVSDSPFYKEMLDLGWELRRVEQKQFNCVDPYITSVCDFACDHCWAHLGNHRMSVATFEQLLNFCDAAGIKSILFTGGEPTLNPDIETMAAMAKSRGFSLTLKTHANHLTNKTSSSSKYKTVGEMAVNLFDEICVSVDGLPKDNFNMRPAKSLIQMVATSQMDRAQAAQQQFDKTIAGYELLCECASHLANPPNIAINTVVTEKNCEGIAELARFFERKVKDSTRFKIDRWDLTQVMPRDILSSKPDRSLCIEDEIFFDVAKAVTKESPSITKRLKPEATARTLVVDTQGNIEIASGEHINFGNINDCDNPHELMQKIRRHTDQTGLFSDALKRQLIYHAKSNPKGLKTL